MESYTLGAFRGFLLMCPLPKHDCTGDENKIKMGAVDKNDGSLVPGQKGSQLCISQPL